MPAVYSAWWGLDVRWGVGGPVCFNMCFQGFPVVEIFRFRAPW